jgi:TetR/AcrR family transcriptional regulator, transcriptional repressor for nem operon
MSRNLEFDQKRILKIATELFWRKGYYYVSTQDLLDHTGIGRSSLYNSFISKDHLFILCLKEYIANNQNAIVNALNFSKNAYTAFSNLFYEIINGYTILKVQKGCFLVNTAIELAPHNNKIQLIVNQNREEIIKLFQQKIQTSTDFGFTTSNKNSKQLSEFYFVLISGLNVESKSSIELGHLESVCNNALKLLL